MSGDLLTGAGWPPITLTDQIRCVEREIRKRRQVYPRLVYTGKLTQGAADREIAVMTEVLVTLKQLYVADLDIRASLKAHDGEPNPS